MAFDFLKKNKEEKKKEEPGKAPAPVLLEKQDDLKVFKNEAKHSHLLKRPYITEKATILADEQNQYVFQVAPRANKTEIKKAIENIYKVKVLKINIVNLPAKTKGSGKLQGETKGVKKAIVKLKAGDKIEILT